MPNALQGLNLIYPPSRSAPDGGHAQDLTPPPGFPDLTAQLDLWTHLSFASDEPFIDARAKEGGLNTLDLEDKKLAEIDEVDEMHQITSQHLIDKPAQTPIDNDNSPVPAPDPQLSSSVNGTPGSFDLGSFLAGFGIDPFLVPPQTPADSEFSTLSSLPISSLSSLSSLPSPSDPSSSPGSKPDSETLPLPKRTRTRKGSIISQTPAIAPTTLQRPENVSRAVSEFSDDHDPLTTPLTAAEDKRRRNTAASARFRAKKKEREQALEKRGKELESRVSELERECEGLRRENGWLKGLVVGVTGGNPSNVPSAPADDDATGHESKKRKRDSDVEAMDN